MPRVRVTNDTDEPITIEPDETVDIFGEQWRRRLMSSRQQGFRVEFVGSRRRTNSESETRRHSDEMAEER